MKHSLKLRASLHLNAWMAKRRQAFPFGWPIFWGKLAVSFREGTITVHSNSQTPSFSSAGAKHRGRNIKRPPAGRPCFSRHRDGEHWRSSKLNKDLRTNHICLGICKMYETNPTYMTCLSHGHEQKKYQWRYAYIYILIEKYTVHILYCEEYQNITSIIDNKAYGMQWIQ